MMAKTPRRRSIPAPFGARALTWSVVLAALTMAVTAAACGRLPANQPSTISVSMARHYTTMTRAEPASRVTLMTASSAYGPILETGSGIAVYYFTSDPGSTSHCSGACLRHWLPLILKGKLRIAAGLSASLVGHIVRPGGAVQLSYDGHPLYTSSRDHARGQLNGQDVRAFGGTWFVVPANGKTPFQPTTTPTASQGGTGI